jgi:hypothetical protein
LHYAGYVGPTMHKVIAQKCPNIKVTVVDLMKKESPNGTIQM